MMMNSSSHPTAVTMDLSQISPDESIKATTRISDQLTYFTDLPHILMDRLAQHPDMTHYELAVYYHYVRACFDAGSKSCRDSVDTIAQARQMSRTKVIAARKWLSEHGYIAITKTGRSISVKVIDLWLQNAQRYPAAIAKGQFIRVPVIAGDLLKPAELAVYIRTIYRAGWKESGVAYEGTRTTARVLGVSYTYISKIRSRLSESWSSDALREPVHFIDLESDERILLSPIWAINRRYVRHCAAQQKSRSQAAENPKNSPQPVQNFASISPYSQLSTGSNSPYSQHNNSSASLHKEIYLNELLEQEFKTTEY